MTWSPDPELYFEEFVRYYGMAKIQQAECNVGTIPHTEGTIQDELMQRVTLYDVCEIRYAGFQQIMLDLWHGYTEEHPYWGNMHSVREPIARSFTGARDRWDLEAWLYVWIIHAVTGSAINYAKQPSGYHNTILPHFSDCDDLVDMVMKAQEVLSTGAPAYTSVGYQFPRFPKAGSEFKRGGDRFIVDYLPRLVVQLARMLESAPTKRTFRQIREFMIQWNNDNDLVGYKFQYAAALATLANWRPDLVDIDSQFFHGTNAVECLSYITGGSRSLKNLDAAAERYADATGGRLYDLEDVACDAIRWIENYIRPGDSYDHLDRDAIWNTSKIKDHPKGRQKPMLELGLVDSFNDWNKHPSDFAVLEQAGWSTDDYVECVHALS